MLDIFSNFLSFFRCLNFTLSVFQFYSPIFNFCMKFKVESHLSYKGSKKFIWSQNIRTVWDHVKVWTNFLTKMVWSKWPKLKQNNLHLICQNIGYGPLTSWFANFDIKLCISWDFILPKFFCMIFGFLFWKISWHFRAKI